MKLWSYLLAEAVQVLLARVLPPPDVTVDVELSAAGASAGPHHVADELGRVGELLLLLLLWDVHGLFLFYLARKDG